jgi:hypothetical protein
MAAKALGWETVPVTWIDVDAKQELRILMADNRTTRLGQDDDAKLADILSELAATEIGLDGTGYSPQDLDALIGEIAQQDDQIGLSLPEKKERYLANDVRQIVLYYQLERYEVVVKAFERYMQESGLEDFAEVVERLLGVEETDGNTETDEEQD